MKRIILMALAIAAFTVNGVKAQNNGSDNNSQNREERINNFISNSADRLAKQMNLSDSKVADFKALYTEYKKEDFAIKFGDRKNFGNFKKDGQGKRPEITDAKADSLMKAGFEIQKKELALKEKYYNKFKSQIGAANAMKVLAERPAFNRDGQRPGGRQGNRDRGM